MDEDGAAGNDTVVVNNFYIFTAIYLDRRHGVGGRRGMPVCNFADDATPVFGRELGAGIPTATVCMSR